MKKMPQPDKQSPPSSPQEDEAAAVATAVDGSQPVLPGTEQPRSLGKMLREAEAEHDASEQAVSAEAPASKHKKVKKVSRSQSRRYARERALQALYQWDVSGSQASDVCKQFMDEQDMSRVDVDYFIQLFNGVSHKPDTIDEAMTPALDRPIANLDPIERSVLRIATYELTECPEIPARVIINEGIEVTKRFGADKGHRYVNGVLDKLAAAVRPLEMKKR